jgi:gliding motility-associated-like protein
MQVNVNPLLEAKLQTPAVGCAPYRASFTNLSGTADVTWQFSDGTSTNVENPVKLFPQPGTYQVRIIARDPNTCNKIDTSAFFSIIVSDKPDASFSWQPNPPVANTPVQFTNLSTGAVRYQWDFGDGTGSTQENPRHLYNETGLFTVRMVAFNQYNCTDTFSTRVRTLINPLLDVPNAFTPGRFGENAQIAVRGFGITRMEWKIYNRWGQLVFQTNDPQKAWDGTVNGKPQPMDVYTYTLEASFSNGKSITKTGDITLIR